MGHWKARVVILVAAALSLAGTSSGYAQTIRSEQRRILHVYATGGIVAPITVFSDRYKPGMGSGAALGISPRSVSDGEIEFVLRAQIEKCPPQSESRPNITFLSGGMDIKYNLSPRGRHNLFLIMGAGFTQTQWSEWTDRGLLRPSWDEMDLYGEAGGGIEMGHGSLAPFIQVRLKDVTGKAMGNFYFFKLEAGVRL